MSQTENFQEIKKNSLISTFSLFFQSGYSAVLGLIANLVLTIVINPKTYGLYIVVLSMISFLNYFSDIGLAASLVQKKEITDEDIKTTFTVQQILIITSITIGYLLTPLVRNAYDLPQEGIYLYWALLLAFFISSLKTIPSILLERKIQFQKIVTVQIIENTIFYIAIIIFALMGFGLYSFVFAVLMRAISGLFIMYFMSFWQPRIGISKASLKTLLSFGIPFQSSSFLALIKDEFITLYLGKAVGLEGVGYIGWAKRWAEAPIRIIMDNLSRVLFPILARIQHDNERVSRVIEKIVYYQTLVLAPVMIGTVLLMAPLVHIIPKYSKWEPALPLFYLFVISAFFSTYSTPFINLFNATGKVKISFGFMIFWTVATWLLTPILTKIYGMYGFPITQVLLSFTFIVIVMRAKKIIDFNFFKATAPSIASAIAMAAIIVVLGTFIKAPILFIVVSILAGSAIYYSVLRFLFHRDPITDIISLIKHE